MIFDIITPFPDLIQGAFNESILKRAQQKDLAEITMWNLRDFTNVFANAKGIALMCVRRCSEIT